MEETRKVPKLLLGVTLLMLWWTVSVFIEDGPFSNYGTRLSEFESSYGVDSSEIAGCWGDTGGEWVNTCASRANDAGWAWVFPFVFFLFFAAWTAFRYLGGSIQTKSDGEAESENPSAT
jgi:hypothetical protein